MSDENQNKYYNTLNVENFDYENSSHKQSDRYNFIRKVYGILLFQLIITFGIAYLAFIDSIKKILIENEWIYYSAIIFSIIPMIILLCYKKLASKVPINYILLFIFTICEGVSLSYLIISVNNAEVVVKASALTIICVIALTIYAFNTTTDYTMCGGALIIGMICLLFLGLISYFTQGALENLYICGGIFIFSLYILYDTQLLMGNFGTEFGIDDYIIACLHLYLDILNLFYFILRTMRR
jgi:FtsH-binding integral membrane protein